jgi:hypothetical protein
MTQASAAGRRPRSWRRRLLFAALASLLSLGLLEGLARVGMRYFGPVDYRPDDLDAEMHIVAASGRQ